jgi:drug/metabolite transporter (DMT)-like permease
VKLKVHIALFTVSLLYAILFSFAGEIMPKYLDPGLFVWMRVFVAAGLFITIARFTTKSKKIDWKTDGKAIAICAFLGTSGNMLLFFYGLRYTLPINGAVLMLCTPIMVAIIQHSIYRVPPKILQILGFILATFCCYLLISSKGFSVAKGDTFGDILVAINAAFYAFYLVRVKPLFINTVQID